MRVRFTDGMRWMEFGGVSSLKRDEMGRISFEAAAWTGPDDIVYPDPPRLTINGLPEHHYTLEKDVQYGVDHDRLPHAFTRTAEARFTVDGDLVVERVRAIGGGQYGEAPVFELHPRVLNDLATAVKALIDQFGERYAILKFANTVGAASEELAEHG